MSAPSPRFFLWVAKCCKLLGKDKSYGRNMMPSEDPSWYFCFDDGLKPEEAVAKYQAHVAAVAKYKAEVAAAGRRWPTRPWRSGDGIGTAVYIGDRPAIVISARRAAFGFGETGDLPTDSIDVIDETSWPVRDEMSRLRAAVRKTER